MNRKRTRQYKQGIFRPVHPEKYRGSLPIYYRSSYESKAFLWLDRNIDIISWGSESVIIPYQNPLTGRISRYFVDVNFSVRDPKTGEIRKYLVEIKPESQTRPPVPGKKMSKSFMYRQAEYAKNCAKWTAAQQWAAKKGYSFQLITEKHLGIK